MCACQSASYHELISPHAKKVMSNSSGVLDLPDLVLSLPQWAKEVLIFEFTLH